MDPTPAAWWFLALAIWSALLAINAWRPLYRPTVISGLSFFAGWWTSDLALHHLAIQAGLSAWLVLSYQVLDTWVGWLGLGLLGLAWIGLIACQVRAMGTARAIENQIGSLGEGSQQDREPTFPHRPSPWSWIQPIPIRPRQVEKIADRPYRQEEGKTLKLDVYRHKTRPQGCPSLLFFHGGGWIIGSKREQGLPLIHHLAAQGWVCFSANYSLSPKSTFPEAIMDCKRALRFIREQGAQYGADPDFVVVCGGSAGGHLASLLALTANKPELQPGFEKIDTAVQGCIAMYGVYDLVDEENLANPGLRGIMERLIIKQPLSQARELYQQLSPINQISPAAPPFLALHGTADTMAPIGGARKFIARLRRESQAAVDYAELPGGHHAFDVFPAARCHGAIMAAARWARQLHASPRN